MPTGNKSPTAEPNLQDLQSVTVATALEFSELAYADRNNDTGDLMSESDPQHDNPLQQTMTDAGWTQITGLPEGNVTADHYQGIAFYKEINGVTEVVIANRGSATALGGDSISQQGPSKYFDWRNSDATVATGGTPASDADALNYYNAVVDWLNLPAHVITSGGSPNPLDIVETGHSLGGQEADFVQVSVQNDTTNSHPTTRTVSFDAPGVPTGLQVAGRTYNAVDVTAHDEIVHTGGSLQNGGFAGSVIELTAGTPYAPYRWTNFLGLATGSPMGTAMQTFAWGARNGVVGLQNHGAAVLDAYEASHPYLFGIDLRTVQPNQINQTTATALELPKYTAAAYAQETDESKQIVYTGVLGAPSQIPDSREIDESFTSSSSGDTTTLTESGAGSGDFLSVSESGTTATLDDNTNMHMVQTFAADGTTLLGDSWHRGDDGIKGTDTFGPGGSSQSLITYQSGGFAKVLADGSGNFTIDYYSKTGALYGFSWLHSDGSSGSGSVLNTGLTLSGMDQVPASLYIQTVNPNGSYTMVSVDPSDINDTSTYNSAGAQLSHNSAPGGGENYDRSNTTSTTTTGADGTTIVRNSAPDGDLVSVDWTKSGDVSGEVTYNESGAISGKEVHSGITTETFTLYGTPGGAPTTLLLTGTTDNSPVPVGTPGPYDITHDFYDASTGNFSSDEFSLSDGASGNLQALGSNSAIGQINHNDGTTSNVTVSADFISIDNLDSDGHSIGQDLWHTDGSHSIEVDNADGSRALYDYSPTGQMTETTYDKINVQTTKSTAASGALLSPDGSQFGKIVNGDGTYTVVYTDSNGDSTEFIFNQDGSLKATDHVSVTRNSENIFNVQTSDGQTLTSPYNTRTGVSTNGAGEQFTEYFDNSGNETGLDWAKPDGSHGYDEISSGNPVSGLAYNTDGTYSSYVQDAAGDRTTQLYAANGTLLSEFWQDIDGSHGGDNYIADGSRNGGYVNADGTFANYVDDGVGNITESDYSSGGQLAADEFQRSDGSYGDETVSSDGSKIGEVHQGSGTYSLYQIDAAGNNLTRNYTASNSLVSTVHSLVDGHGDSTRLVFDSAGNAQQATWTLVDGTSGSVDLTQLAANAEVALQIVTDSGSVAATGSSGGIIVASGANDTLTSGAGASLISAGGEGDSVVGGTGNDTLIALSGDVTLVGGTGNTLFVVTDVTDVVEVPVAGGNDTIQSSVDYTLPTNVDTLILVGSGDLTASGNDDATNQMTGNAGNDLLQAGSGSDTLISGTGIDTLVAGFGTDVFYVNNSADEIQTPYGWEFQDTVYSSVSYDLTASVGNLILTGTDSLSARDDFGYATIVGNSGNDTLTAGSGVDTIISGTGVSTLVAGSGFNTLVVNNADDVIEATGASSRVTVQSSVSFTLGEHLQTLDLIGSADVVGRGNDEASNYISGNSGNDTLIAGSGADTLVAGLGIDTLIAGTGADVLQGRAGDTYELDAGFGNAKIETSAGSAVLRFGSGIAAADLTLGIAFDDNGAAALTISDGGGTATISGGFSGSISSFQFADGENLSLAQLLQSATVTSETVTGAAGDAILAVGSGETINGGFGNDTIVAVGSNDTLAAGTGNQDLIAFGDGNLLTGGVGDDALYGAGQGDMLATGTGNTSIRVGGAPATYSLAQGGTTTLDATEAEGVQTILLPSGTSSADFAPFSDLNGNLVLQSINGATSLVIDGFYSSPGFWLLQDSNGNTQPLKDWAGTRPTGQGYRTEMDLLRQEFAASLPATLNDIGLRQASLDAPSEVTTPDDYNFGGTSVQNLTVSGGSLHVGTSDTNSFHSSTTTTGFITTTYQQPIYGEVTYPGSYYDVPVGSPSLNDAFNNGQIGTPITNPSGQVVAYRFVQLPETMWQQTGSSTITETSPITSTYLTQDQSFTDYNIVGDGGDDSITADPHFVGTVQTGDGNVTVDLGGTGPAGGHPFYSSPEKLGVGAFVEAGDGNDTIYGSGGADILVAGNGFDVLAGALGSQFYVPLEGDSTDVIYAREAYYGSGPFPHNTLVLPDGITPSDLNYALIADPAQTYGDNSQILQISHGDSSVLLYFDAGAPNTANGGLEYLTGTAPDDTDGINRFQFSDGTVLTRAQVLAMAGAVQSADSRNPVATLSVSEIVADSAAPAGDWFSGTATGGGHITWYQVTNSADSGAHFTLDGKAQAAGQAFLVSQDQLGSLVYFSGDSESTDQVQVSAFDGAMWGQATTVEIEPGSGGQALQPRIMNQPVTAGSDSHTEHWSARDASNEDYWWNSSMRHYQESWLNSGESGSTEHYRYAAMGSLGDVSMGVGQYRTSADSSTLAWSSSDTDATSHITMNVGFIGLHHEDTSSGTQPEVHSLNLAVSRAVGTFLTAHS